MNDITQEIFGNQLYTVGKKSDTSKQVFTPTKVVDDMIDLLPAEIFNPDTTFIDIYCKSGIFLKRIYEKLDLALQKLEKFTNPEIRRNHILNNQIYGLVMDNSGSLLLCNKVIYGDAFHDGHLLYLDSVNVVGYSNYEDILHKMNPTKIKETIEKMFNRQGLGFDVVVGNPPYNRGGDIDFVNLGYELCNKYTVMITPAKWQTAEANQRIDSQMSYGDFRKKIVPHIREVVYYPNCQDIFNIAELDGIQYYRIDKLNTYENCKVRNICKNQKLLEQTCVRSIINQETLNNLGHEFLNQLGNNYKPFKASENHVDLDDTYALIGSNKYANERGVKGQYQALGIIQYAQGQMSVIRKSRIVLVEDLNIEMQTADTVIMTQNNKYELLQFKSYIEQRFVRWLLAINISRQSPIFCNLQFKYVPEPMILDDLGNRVAGKFDHLYTDYELFNTWNISSEMCENICKIVKDYNDLVQQVYKENAIRIFVKAKGVEENLNKIKEIQQKYKERAYDNSQEGLEIVTDLQDLDQCKGSIDNQISLIDSVQFQIEKLLYYFSSYYTVENSWDAGKPIQIVLPDGQQKIVHADSIMQEIMTVHRGFLNKQGWNYVKQKIMEYGLCSSKQLELLDFMYSLLEILTMVQFDNRCLEILGKSEISCENIGFGKTIYNIIR